MPYRVALEAPPARCTRSFVWLQVKAVWKGFFKTYSSGAATTIQAYWRWVGAGPGNAAVGPRNHPGCMPLLQGKAGLRAPS